jgi:aspartokinase-like uncharacterized kinase
LPHTWQVTSDSIAAWTATMLSADELVLLKSVPLPSETTFEQAAHAGLVDEQFPTFARALARVSWVDPRDTPVSIRPWPGF